MKTKKYLIIVLSVIFASCSSLQQSTVNDDLYYSPEDDVVAQKSVNSNYTKSNKVSKMDFEKEISAVLDDKSKENVDTVLYENKETGNSYEDILVEDRNDAYERRLNAMSSPYYGFDNYILYNNDALWYASAYDPAYYNIVVMGDQVWVEPRYISASFGYWPRRSYIGYNWSYWNSSYYDCYYGYGYPYYGYYSYYSPYHYYSPYYSSYYSYYNPWYYGSYANQNYVSSSFTNYRNRSLASRYSAGSGAVRSGRTRAELPETYMGRGVSRSSTVKSGLNRQSTRVASNRSGVSSERRTSTRTIDNRRRTTSSTGVSTRTGSNSRSTYTRSNSGSSTRYNRPSSASRSSSVNRSSSERSSGRSSYSNSRSGSRSNSSTYRSSGSSRNSSVGRSSSTRSSGSSTNSSGSSTRSSTRSSRGSRR